MKQLFTLAAAAAMFTACSINGGLDQTPPIATERVPLNVTTANSVSATVSTRSNVNDIQATVLDPTSTITTGLFVIKEGEFTKATTETYRKWNLAASTYASLDAAHTNITPSNADPDNTLYYPDSKTQGIDIYAYAPRHSAYAGTDIATDVEVVIQSNQNTKANYLLSDVLWGCVGAGTNGGSDTAPSNYSSASITAANYLDVIKPTPVPHDGFISSTGQVIVPMFHKASKVIVKITPSGMALDKLKGATVNFFVQGTNSTTPKLTTNLNVKTGTLTSVVAETSEVLAPITFTSHLGQNEDGTADLTNAVADANGTHGVIGVANTSMTGYACSGIILPQTITKGQKLIEITLADTNTTKYAYKIPSDASSDPTFSSGKVYTYTITITASGLKVTSTIADWVDDSSSLPGSGTGNAELQ